MMGVGIGFRQLLIGPFRSVFVRVQQVASSILFSSYSECSRSNDDSIPEYSLGTCFSIRQRLKALICTRILAVHWHRDRKEVIVATITNTYCGEREKKNGSFFLLLLLVRKKKKGKY